MLRRLVGATGDGVGNILVIRRYAPSSARAPNDHFLMIRSGCDHIATSLLREVLADGEQENICQC
jgi:hypothetical protein